MPCFCAGVRPGFSEQWWDKCSVRRICRAPLLILRCNADVGHSKKTLYACPFAEVVTFDLVSKPLQHVAKHEGAYAPVPVLPRPHEEEHHACHRQRNAD